MLVLHNRKHTGDKPFKCNTCGHTTTQQSNLKTHIQNIHTNEHEMVECELCSKNVRKKQLKTHMNSHKTSRPFQCPDCDGTFKYKEQLKKHTTVHQDIRPNHCMICPKKVQT